MRTEECGKGGRCRKERKGERAEQEEVLEVGKSEGGGGGKGEGGKQRGRLEEEGWEATRKEGGMQSEPKAWEFISAKDVFAMGMVAIAIAPHHTRLKPAT